MSTATIDVNLVPPLQASHSKQPTLFKHISCDAEYHEIQSTTETCAIFAEP